MYYNLVHNKILKHISLYKPNLDLLHSLVGPNKVKTYIERIQDIYFPSFYKKKTARAQQSTTTLQCYQQQLGCCNSTHCQLAIHLIKFEPHACPSFYVKVSVLCLPGRKMAPTRQRPLLKDILGTRMKIMWKE